MLMAFIGALTALFAATIALAQNDIKRVLAYSTISQLGYMVAAIGIGAYVAAAFHLVTHAFFKALLFLGSGSVIHGVEHGVLHTGEHIDPNDMYNMGGLKKKMPVTFWTFLIGGFALSGFPLVTAGFWSKDEILADAFGHGHWVVFITLALAALLTAFYTMRQISLTFLGEPRTEAAEHAHETPWTMTVPLVILAVFAIAYGWVGIPEHFPVLGGLIPNWFHDWVGSTLAEHPEAVSFSVIPLLTSLVVALGGLLLGWFVYRNVPQGTRDPLEKPLGSIYTLLKNKYYFDELYDKIFVQPAYWFAETFVYEWMDRGVIDGILHTVSRAAFGLGQIFRNWIDVPIVNGFGDFMGEGVKKLGRSFRVLQTGRVQQYMIIALVFAFGTLFYFLYRMLLP
jgi:NADH-quinone oxidoreductase subunit L